MKYKAFLFDLNGTMIDDMSYHIRAWHGILTGLGSDISMEQTKLECYGKNDELLERVFPGRFPLEERYRIGLEKEKRYQQEFRPHLALLPGLGVFLKESHKRGIKMAIGSAALLFNIDFVIDGLNIRHYFDAIVSADDVAISKPDPETFVRCAEALGIPPSQCLVFEDSPKGVEAAARAEMDSAVLTTMHDKSDFDSLKRIIHFSGDFKDPGLLAAIGLSRPVHT